MLNTTIGKIAEMDFAKQCMQRGLHVSLPLNDCSGYDAIVEKNGKLIKVQIKSAKKRSHGKRAPEHTYRFAVVKGRLSDIKYENKHYDVLACYVHELNLWYFFSFKDVKTTNLRVYPMSPNSKYEVYRENWDIIYDTF